MLSDVMWSGAHGDESKAKRKILSAYQSILDEGDRADSSLYRKKYQSAKSLCSLLAGVVDSAVSRA
jgi:hypothetical protein